MQELIKLLKANAGLNDEQAIKTVQVMRQFLDGKVPAMFRGVVDKFFADAPSEKNDDPLDF
jgi:hypothetical protein